MNVASALVLCCPFCSFPILLFPWSFPCISFLSFILSLLFFSNEFPFEHLDCHDCPALSFLPSLERERERMKETASSFMPLLSAFSLPSLHVLLFLERVFLQCSCSIRVSN